MRLVWFEGAWEDYLYWQTQDRKTLRRINKLVKDTQRDPRSGLGKSEPLKGELSGCFSRRIDEENRLVYRLRGDTLEILQCRGHYHD
ncbi:Txe/YoeB family addiction module toxin [uncultured Mobiluncus sp.]|uniref:Txe/YoeB family addiction module toxin n=1 Tax=uncultured Mobiluncus sp. TaxID=293425 RepID=UPI002888FCAA|nr:Txe/YoeB family addiction module toxin [uncultured Mobiluncus sp.]